MIDQLKGFIDDIIDLKFWICCKLVLIQFRVDSRAYVGSYKTQERLYSVIMNWIDYGCMIYVLFEY